MSPLVHKKLTEGHQSWLPAQSTPLWAPITPPAEKHRVVRMRENHTSNKKAKIVAILFIVSYMTFRAIVEHTTTLIHTNI